LKKNYEFDHHSFVQQLKKISYSRPFNDFFSALLEFSMDIDDDAQFNKLIAHTFCFYDLELITDAYSERILRSLPSILQ
jgi:hypothetical protein